MSDVVAILDIRDAIEEMIVGGFTFTSTVRQNAQRQVRDLCQDRVYDGRRPVNTPLPAIVYMVTEANVDTFLGGSDKCGDSMFLLRVLADIAREKTLIADALRQMFDVLGPTSVTTIDGALNIGSIVLALDHGDIEPEDPINASDVWRFGYEMTLMISHEFAAPSGII